MRARGCVSDEGRASGFHPQLRNPPRKFSRWAEITALCAAISPGPTYPSLLVYTRSLKKHPLPPNVPSSQVWCHNPSHLEGKGKVVTDWAPVLAAQLGQPQLHGNALSQRNLKLEPLLLRPFSVNIKSKWLKWNVRGREMAQQVKALGST